MKGKTGLSALVGLGCLVGCATNEGRVMNKIYKPAEVRTITISFRGIPVPIPIYIPEEHRFALRSHDDGKMKIEIHHVSKDSFHLTNSGDWYICAPDKREYQSILSLSESIKYPAGTKIPIAKNDRDFYFPDRE
jgi:hypothetical protein